MEEKKFYTITEVARRVGVHADTLRRWVRTGRIPEPRRDRNDWRVFSESEIQQIISFATFTKPSSGSMENTLMSGSQ